MSPTSMTVSCWSSSFLRADGGTRALRGSWRHRTSPIFDRAWESLEVAPGRLSHIVYTQCFGECSHTLAHGFRVLELRVCGFGIQYTLGWGRESLLNYKIF